jgi:hypothetical protein
MNPPKPTHAFVPLLATPPAPASVAGRPGDRMQFESIVPVAESGSSVPPPVTAAPGQHPAPQVTFKKEGDRITQIVIRCSCDHPVVLDCVY